MTKRPRARAGMSLIELLAAVAVLAVVTTIVYGSLSRTLAAREYALARASLFAEARSAFSWLERDMRSSFDTGGYGSELSRFWSQTGSEETAVLDLTALGSRGTTPLEGLWPLPPTDRSDQARVVYRLAGEPGTFDLVRYEIRPPGPFDEATASRTVVASGLGSVEMRFFNGRRWQDGWTGQNAKRQAPRAAEITLTFTDAAGGESLVLSSATSIPR